MTPNEQVRLKVREMQEDGWRLTGDVSVEYDRGQHYIIVPMEKVVPRVFIKGTLKNFYKKQQ